MGERLNVSYNFFLKVVIRDPNPHDTTTEGLVLILQLFNKYTRGDGKSHRKMFEAYVLVYSRTTYSYLQRKINDFTMIYSRRERDRERE